MGIGLAARQPRWPRDADDGNLVDLLLEWVPNEAKRRRILVDNPNKLYGF